MIDSIERNLADYEAFSNERTGSLSFDSMICGREDLCFEFRMQCFEGVDSSCTLDMLTQKFHEMAQKVDATIKETLDNSLPTDFDDSDTPNNAGPSNGGNIVEEEKNRGKKMANAGLLQGRDGLKDNIKNIAKHHLIFKYTVVHDGIKQSFVVATANLAELKAASISGLLHSILIALYAAGLSVCFLVGDGASENALLFASLSQTKISHFLPVNIQQRFRNCLKAGIFDEPVAMKNPCSGEYVFIAEDMPHVIKRIVNAMEMSTIDPKTRNLWFGDNPINLGAIRDIWLATEGSDYGLKTTKLSRRHFSKTSYSRMTVHLATQVLSESVANLMEKAIEDPEMDLSMEGRKYQRLIELIRHCNKLVDICNGRKFKNNPHSGAFTRLNAVPMRESLLEILEWFDSWKLSIKERPISESEMEEARAKDGEDVAKGKTKKAKEYRALEQQIMKDRKKLFFSDQTWTGVKGLILAMVGLLECYVIDQDYSINPRNCNSDPCEKHFGNTRQLAGSTDAITVLTANQADNNANAFGLTHQNPKGNTS